MTGSPTVNQAPGPTASTVPAASQPSPAYGPGTGPKNPAHTAASAGLSAAAATLIRTSFSPGTGTGTSSTVTAPGPPVDRIIAAFMIINSSRERAARPGCPRAAMAHRTGAWENFPG